MNTQAPHPDPPPSDPAPGETSPPRRLAHTLWGYRGTLLWLIFGAFLLMMLWPMLKGSYYKMSGPAPADGIPWQTDYAAALAESQKTGKPLLLDFTASWCPPCQVMKHEVWPQPEVRETIVGDYIPVLLDIDQPGSADASRRYGVSSIPAVFVVNGNGNVLRAGSYKNKAQMLEFLKTPATAG